MIAFHAVIPAPTSALKYDAPSITNLEGRPHPCFKTSSRSAVAMVSDFVSAIGVTMAYLENASMTHNTKP